MLDEVANFAHLPDLPTYISAYRGSGIVTFAVIQDLAQLEGRLPPGPARRDPRRGHQQGHPRRHQRRRPPAGRHAAHGERDEETWSTSRSGIAQHSVSSPIRLRPVLDTGEIRGLAEGTALMLFKGNPPTLIQMTPYNRRPEATNLAADQQEWESIIAAQALARAEVAFGSAE
jgi:type IV secretion system protein VirD4